MDGKLTAGRLLIACLAAAAAAAPIFAQFERLVAWEPALLAGAGGLVTLVAALAAAVAVPVCLRVFGLKRGSAARMVSIALAVDVYAVGWGLRLPGGESLAAESSLFAGVATRAASLPLETWLVLAAALTVVAAAALAFSDALFSGRFCRRCGTRCRPEGDTVECAAPPLEEVEARLRSRNWSFFRPLGPPSRRGHGLRFRLYSCGCGRTTCFDLTVLRRFKRNRALARLELLSQEDMRALRRVTHDILHPARAADWLVPTEARIHRAVTGQRQSAAERTRMLRIAAGDGAWRLASGKTGRHQRLPAPQARGKARPPLYTRSWTLVH